MSGYIPERNDIIWLDFEPSKGKEIGKYSPATMKPPSNKSAGDIFWPTANSCRVISPRSPNWKRRNWQRPNNGYGKPIRTS